MLEKQIQRKIMDYLRDLKHKGHPIRCFKVAQGPYSEPGISDIIVCYNGMFYALEVKRSTGVLSPIQRKFLEDIRNAGGFAHVVRSIEDVKAIIPPIK